MEPQLTLQMLEVRCKQELLTVKSLKLHFFPTSAMSVSKFKYKVLNFSSGVNVRSQIQQAPVWVTACDYNANLPC